MLELTPKQAIEKQVDKEARKDLKHIASMMPHKGQFIFKYDMKERKVSVIQDSDHKKQSVGLNEKVNKKLILDKNCLYVVALNKKNAAKKFQKLLRNALTAVR